MVAREVLHGDDGVGEQRGGGERGEGGEVELHFGGAQHDEHADEADDERALAPGADLLVQQQHGQEHDEERAGEGERLRGGERHVGEGVEGQQHAEGRADAAARHGPGARRRHAPTARCAAAPARAATTPAAARKNSIWLSL